MRRRSNGDEEATALDNASWPRMARERYESLCSARLQFALPAPSRSIFAMGEKRKRRSQLMLSNDSNALGLCWLCGVALGGV